MHMSKEVEFKSRDRFIQLGITIAALRKMRGMSQETVSYTHLARADTTDSESRPPSGGTDDKKYNL